jgi:hypothetical protein
MKTSEVFKEAKKRLHNGARAVPDGKSLNICHAIDHAVDHGVPSKDAALAQELVMQRLKPHFGVFSWLGAVAGAHLKRRTRQNLQTYRHAWLDALVKEFEAKGD